MPASPKFKTIITDYGKQRLIAAMSPGGTKLTLTQMAVGDGGGNPTNPDTTNTALVNEVWRAAVNSVSVDKKHSNIIIVELLIPAEVGGFWIREAGIYDEFNKLVAICSLPASEKPLLEQGSGRAQTVRMTLVISDLSTINITIDSTTIIATNDYVDNSLKEHEKSRNHPDATLTDKGFVQLSSATGSTDETMAATPKAVKAAMDNANKRQPGNENLTALSSLAGQPDKVPYFTNKGAMSLAEFAAFMRTMLSKTDAASVLEYLGLKETVERATNAVQKTGDEMTGDLKLKSDARIHLTILNADGTPRLYIFKDKDGDGVHINNANDGGGDFVFNKDGGFYAPSYLHAGNAYMQGDGNIWGTRWNASGQWLWDAIVEQLNTRGTIDWINNQLSIRDRNINTRAAISQVIGIGQTYRVVTNKFLGVTYTNTSQKPWVVVLKINLPTSGEVQIKVNGVMAAGGNAANNAGIAVWAYPSAIVPAGATYVVESAWGNVIQWVELQ
ncbi:phage tail protein [Salmonella enterica]|nr:phage tail protein [Salmonella enterica]EJS8565780.1 phage tail protein [Salmonella enterica]